MHGMRVEFKHYAVARVRSLYHLRIHGAILAGDIVVQQPLPHRLAHHVYARHAEALQSAGIGYVKYGT